MDQCSDLAAGVLDGIGCDPPIGVAGAVRVAVMLGEIRQYRLENTRVDPGRRLVVEINRRRIDHRIRGQPRARFDNNRRHAARARSATPRRCRYRKLQARRKCAISASLELQPRLTRIVEAAISGSTCIAARTWLGPTLPDEQAAPALTITPSRSSATTWVSAAIPGSAIAEVFGKRGAAAPSTTASGAIAAISISRRSRNSATRS